MGFVDVDVCELVLDSVGVVGVAVAEVVDEFVDGDITFFRGHQSIYLL